MKKILNERGFLMLDVIFLTMITALAAMILINAAPRIRNPQASLKLTALYLAEEQFAYLEAGEEPPSDDLIFEDVTFKVDIEKGTGNPCKVTVTVTIEGREDFKVVAERMIYVVQKE